MYQDVAFAAMVEELDDGLHIGIVEQFYLDTVLAAEVLEFSRQV